MSGLQELRRSTVVPPWQSSVRSIDRHRMIRLSCFVNLALVGLLVVRLLMWCCGCSSLLSLLFCGVVVAAVVVVGLFDDFFDEFYYLCKNEAEKKRGSEGRGISNRSQVIDSAHLSKKNNL